MRRRTLIAALGGTVALRPLAAPAQQPGKVTKIGFLYPGTAEPLKPRLAAFSAALKAKGFVEGRNISILTRVADLDSGRLKPLAAELVAQSVDMLAVVGRPATEAARALTRTLPIVAVDLESDPVASGFAASLARPGGNLTGLYFDFPDFSSKWLELLAETVPNLTRLAVLWDPSGGSIQLDNLSKAAAARGVTLQVFKIEGPADIEPAIAAATTGKAQALMALSTPIFGTNPGYLADIALKFRMPAVTWFPEFAEAGGLMAYGTDLINLFQQLGGITAKVLAGTTPADLPIERPTRFQLVVNQKTARALGLTIPLSVLARADQVIE
jgi:putative ABC transport system substrate-binding protein